MPILDTLCVELTSRCPLRCVHCSANATPFGQSYLPVQHLLEFLSCLPQLRELYLSGGEPFEHPEILPLIRAVQHHASIVVAYSSGVTISELKPRSLSHDVLVAARQSGLRRLDISLYAPTPHLHDATTGTPGSFSATLETAMRASHAALPLGIHFVPIGLAADLIVETYSLACRLNATHFHVLALAPQGRARSAISDLAPPTTFWSSTREGLTRCGCRPRTSQPPTQTAARSPNPNTKRYLQCCIP